MLMEELLSNSYNVDGRIIKKLIYNVDRKTFNELT